MDYKKAAKNIWRIAKATFQRFSDNSCFTLSAALSYYTIFSIAPTLVIVITIVGALFGKDAIEGEIYHQIKDLIGNDGAVAIQEFIQHTYEPHNTGIATVIGIITLIFGATGVFNQLKYSINTIWNVRPDPKIEFLKVVTDRVLSFAFILGIGFIMVVTLIINAILAAISDFIVSYFASFSVYILGVVNLSIGIIILTLLFAAMFKVLPDAVTRWKDILTGGFFTAILFILGELLIGYYLGKSDFASTYGAAGSIIIIMVWVNYSSIILFLGASFTYAWSIYHGKEILPNRFSVKLRG